MLLGNIHCTFYESQTSGYFEYFTVPFETYVSQGPQAKEIPSDIIFSRNYQGLNEVMENDSDDDVKWD